LFIASGGEATVQNGGLLTVASSGTITAASGSTINISGTVNVKTGGVANVESGGTLSSASGAAVELNSTVLLGATQPAKNADPGANNRLYSTNTLKAWGKISTDGAGSYTIDDGYNIASVTVNAAYVEITWARAFANADYAPCVTASIPFVPNAVLPNVSFPNQTTTKTRVYFYDVIGAAALAPTTNIVQFSINVPGRQS
jgi:hypothetical protein